MADILNRLQSSLESAKTSAQQTINDVASTNDKIIDMWPNIHDPTAKDAKATTDHGTKVYDYDHWLRVVDKDGKRHGPSLLEDQIARERIHRFDHERIPERVVHARGAGAHGVFKLHKPIPELTSAGILTDTSRHTPVFVRFSTVAGSRGSADTVRDVRGFAVKFYTDEGNWDIVGNNIPVFFIQDAMKFPDFVHAAKPEPHNEVPQAQTAHNNFWDFQYMHSEATHMFMWAMSDRAIPRSYRMMQGFGVNTFTLLNSDGKMTFVKFIWTPELGVHSFVWDEALKLAGQDPDFHRKDLWEAIENGAYPRWRFGIQTISEADQDNFEFDILDATKVWPEEIVPINYIGELVLNRNVDEYFPETEQVAFCTSHVVPGIGFSDDPLLQGRNFSYFDTQITRLGVNFQQLPINRPVCPVMNFNRDGQMSHRIHKGTVNYWPNRFDAAPPGTHTGDKDTYREFPAPVVGNKVRLHGAKFKEHFNQAQTFYNSLVAHEKAHIKSALAFELDHCDDPIVYERIVTRLADIDTELAKDVATMVGGSAPESGEHTNHGKTAKGLSMTEYAPETPTIASRRVAILVADGFNSSVLTAVKGALTSQKALPFVIGPRRSKVVAESGEKDAVQPDHHMEGMRSTMFDAVFICPGSDAAVKTLSQSGRAIHWIREAFGHLKTIGAVGNAIDFLRNAVRLPGIELASSSKSLVACYGVITSVSEPSGSLKSMNLKADHSNFIDTFGLQISQHKCFKRESDGLAAQVAF